MPASRTVESPLTSYESSDPAKRYAFRINNLVTEHGRRSNPNGEMVFADHDIRGSSARLHIGFNPRSISAETSKQYEDLAVEVPTDSMHQTAAMLSQAYDFVAHSDEDTSRPASFLVSDKGEIAWSADTKNETTGLVLVRGDGSAAHLGATGETFGVIDDIGAKDILYMLPNSLIGAMKDTDQFDKDGLKQAFIDTDERNEMTRVRFNDALPKAPNTTEEFKAAHQTKAQRKQRQNATNAPKSQNPPAMYQADVAELTILNTTTSPSVPSKPKRAPKHALDTESTVTPSDRVPKHRLGLGEIETIHDDSHYTVTTQSGVEFTVTDKRRWRDVPAAMQAEPERHGKHVATNEDTADDESESSVAMSPKFERESRIGDVTYKIPPKPDHEPQSASLTNTYDPRVRASMQWSALHGDETLVNNQADQEPEQNRKREKRNPFTYLASRLSSAYYIHKNKREAAGKSREVFGLDANKQEKVAKIALGAVAVSLVGIAAWKLGWEMHNAEVSSAMQVPQPNGGVGLDAARQSGGLDPIQDRVIGQRTEILNSPVNIIPTGGGGEQFAVTNGVDKTLWYQNQDEFMQKFPNEGYRMTDGNVGFVRPGGLSTEAKQFWAQKFGKWQ